MGVGRVYIVGAGPGDPGLLTLKAVELLRRADVVVYDRLVPREALFYAKPGAELIYVGKEPGRHTMTQEEINELLVRKALEGKIVVRLKGGDPYVFGRGEEECMYVLERGVPCEVVPGVTSAIAGPAYAGIPVTSRGVSSSFAVVTGTEAPDKGRRFVDFKALAGAVDTIVVLMGVGSLERIAEELVEGGLDPSTPVAVIEKATTPEQRVLVSTLGRVAEEARRAGVRPPAVVVVGKVVELRERLWRLS